MLLATVAPFNQVLCAHLVLTELTEVFVIWNTAAASKETNTVYLIKSRGEIRDEGKDRDFIKVSLEFRHSGPEILSDKAFMCLCQHIDGTLK